jgi:oxygen-independent coproporphyrinogen-3 oxidase
MPIGLYIHVPFCRTRCHYCAFYLRIYRHDLAQAYVRALMDEIRLHAAARTTKGLPLSTVYFGGGTPTLLPVEDLVHILDTVRGLLGLTGDAEVSLEGTPDSVKEASLCALKAAGFNRLSLGMETTHKDELIAIGRKGQSDPIVESVARARRAGFTNLNLDLIYGLPGQTESSWLTSVDQAIGLAPLHLSTYALAVEPGSRFHVDIHRGDLPELDDARVLGMEEAAVRRLSEAGFERYEISNYSRSGYDCRHNRLYWEGGEYLGLGPSAQSYVGGRRFGVVSDLDRYCEMTAAGRMPIDGEEQLSQERQTREALIFGLRLLAGVDLRTVSSTEIDAGVGPILSKLGAEGLVERKGSRVCLTELGRRHADSVALALV